MIQSSQNPIVMTDQRWKPSFEIAPNCPRCASTNTKFCYYNNYSLSQPRYFCKGCRRYWTKGGSLRNVPVGGGCRRNRRGKSVRIQRSSFVQQQERSHEINSPSISSNGTDVSSGSDIDLAVVFSKFLNQDLNSEPGAAEPELMNSVETNYNSPALQFPRQESSACFKDTPVTDGREHIFSDQFDFPNRNPEDRITDGFSGSDTCSYKLQAGLLNDGFLEDENEYLWSQAAVPSVPNFSWQETAFPGFDEIGSDDPATSFPNLLHGNWSTIA